MCRTRADEAGISGIRLPGSYEPSSDPSATHGCDKPELYVVLGHQEIHRADAAVILDDQIDRGFFRGLAAHASRLRPASCRSAASASRLSNDTSSTLSGVPAASSRFSQSLRRRAHFLDDARADRRILQPLDPFIDAAFLHPRRHRGVQAGRTGGIRDTCSRKYPGRLARAASIFAIASLHLRPVVSCRPP